MFFKSTEQPSFELLDYVNWWNYSRLNYQPPITHRDKQGALLNDSSLKMTLKTLSKFWLHSAFNLKNKKKNTNKINKFLDFKINKYDRMNMF